MQAIRSKAVRAENRDLCKSQADRWVRHFQSILSINSEFCSNAIETVQQRPLRGELDNPPTPSEIRNAVKAIKSEKAAGKNGIKPEVVKRVALVFEEHI